MFESHEVDTIIGMLEAYTKRFSSYIEPEEMDEYNNLIKKTEQALKEWIPNQY